MNTVYTEQMRSLYTEHAASGLSNATHSEGEGGTIFSGTIPAGYHT